MKRILGEVKLRALLVLGILVAGFGFQNCDQVKLSLVQKAVLAESKPDGDYCTLKVSITPGVKFYFVVDVTGSNVGGDTTDAGTPVPASDPGKIIRTEAMQSLALKYPGAQFALRTFAGDSISGTFRTAYYTFSSQQVFLTSTLTEFKKIPDQDGTDYGQVLTQVQTDIQQYLQHQLTLPPSLRDAAGPLVVLFGSDGIPHTGCKDQACMQTLVRQSLSLPVALGATDIITYITGSAFGWGGVFQQGTSDEQRYLRWIADAYGGGLLIASPGVPLDLTKLPLPETQKPQGVNFDLYATNLSGVWDPMPDGTAKFKLDTDGDGLSDDQEAVLGTDPAMADTDSTGLTDGLENFIWGSPCQENGCVKPTVQKRVPVNSCDVIPAAEGGATGFFTNDLLNNCEKIALGTDYHSFSYLKDNVADGVKVRNRLSPTKTTLHNANPDDGGLSMVDKIKQNLPTFIPNALALGYKPTKYTVTFKGDTEGRSCFSFRVEDVPNAGNKPNKVRLWLTQTQANLPDILRTADVMALPGQIITVTDDDFHPNQADIDSKK